MPDIQMCGHEECPRASECVRNPKSGTVPNPHRQAWGRFNFGPFWDAETCSGFRSKTPEDDDV